MNTSPISLSPADNARLTVSGGCPRTKDVRAAKNALYLAKHGKAGGLNLEAAAEVAQKHDDFQAATRFLAHKPYVGPERARYKRQQRPT